MSLSHPTQPFGYLALTMSLVVNKLSKRLLPIQLISGKLNEGESIYANGDEIGKVMIDDEYPFALIKYLDENFKDGTDLKSENAVLRIKVPNWIP